MLDRFEVPLETAHVSSPLCVDSFSNFKITRARSLLQSRAAECPPFAPKRPLRASPTSIGVVCRAAMRTNVVAFYRHRVMLRNRRFARAKPIGWWFSFPWPADGSTSKIAPFVAFAIGQAADLCACQAGAIRGLATALR